MNDYSQIIKPVAAFNESIDSGFYMPFHSHNTLEVAYCLSGILVVEHKDKNDRTVETQLSENQFAIIFPHTVHKMSPLSERCDFFVFELEFLADAEVTRFLTRRTFAGEIPDICTLLESAPKMLYYTDNYEVIDAIRHITKLFMAIKTGEKPRDMFFVADYNLSLGRLLLSVCRCSAVTAELKGNLYIRKSLALIRAMPEQKTSVKAIAQKLGISESYLQRLFKQSMNMSVLSVIDEYRLKLAEKLLADTDLSVRAISKRTGFHSANTFYKRFVQTRAVSPSEYREAKRQKTVGLFVTENANYFDKGTWLKYN
jgi:AraC-like DNA-binding protein